MGRINIPPTVNIVTAQGVPNYPQPLPPPPPQPPPPASLSAIIGREYPEPATVCLIQTTYWCNQGQLQLPVSGPPGTPCEIVELHAPCGVKVVQWVIARNALLPELPDYTALASLGETLAHWELSLVAPGIKVDGVTYEFGQTGVYYYYTSLPPDKASKTGLPYGRRTADGAPGQVLRAAQFTQQWRG